MRIDWWTLGLQAINALVLIYLLARFLFRPIATILAERRAAATRLLAEAEDARAAALAEQERVHSALAEIKADRTALTREAAAEAEREKVALISAAQAEIERMRTDAKADLVRFRKAEEAVMSDRASRLAIDIATKLFDRLPERARVDGFVDGLSNALASLPPETREDLGANGAPILLRSPRALTQEETESCRRALLQALGRPAEFRIEIDPSLIAGLELEERHISVANSLRADLMKIATELGGNESARAE